MRGEFSWLVLVVAFAGVAAACGLLIARLLRIGSAGGPAAASQPAPSMTRDAR
jgi:hypothetical protein